MVGDHIRIRCVVLFVLHCDFFSSPCLHTITLDLYQISEPHHLPFGQGPHQLLCANTRQGGRCGCCGRMRIQHYLPVLSCRRGRPIISKIKCLCRWIGPNILLNCILYMLWEVCGEQERPYHNDSTASRPLCEVKHCRASLVVWWGTTFESDVLFFLFWHCDFFSSPYLQTITLDLYQISEQHHLPFGQGPHQLLYVDTRQQGGGWCGCCGGDENSALFTCLLM